MYDTVQDDTANAIQWLRGVLTPEARKAFVRESFEPHALDFKDEFGYDPTPLAEQFLNQTRRFSFDELGRSIATRESAAGRPMKRVGVREAITTSQAAIAFSLVTVHAIYDGYGTTPAIFRDIAEMVTSNGESEVYPEEFMDDMPVPLGETEPAPESRLGTALTRIRNYVYGRSLVISKRYYELDKTGQVKRFATKFGSKYPIAQDRAFVTGIFKAGVIANLTTNGGIIPPTNIAGQFVGTSYQNASGVTATFAPTPGPINPQRLEDALIAPAFFQDPYGVELVLQDVADTVLCDSADRLKAKRFLTAQYTSNIAGAAGSDATGQQPGAFTDNILKGEFKIAHSPYVKKSRAPLSGQGYPWATLKAKDNGAVMQERKPWDVQQADPGDTESLKTRSFSWFGEGEFGTGLAYGRRIFFGN